MNNSLEASQSIEINALPEKVWQVLTNPEKIKVYLHGTETITDWKVGGAIVFQGEYQGHQYKDKGIVRKNKTNELLTYSYWSGFSGLEDTPENYCLVTYRIESLEKGRVNFTWHQKGFANETGQQHTEQGLIAMLQQIKELAEV